MSTKVKKVFEPILAILSTALAADPKVRLSSIIDEVTKAAEANVGGGGNKATTFHRDENGRVVAIFDYYFKKWFAVGAVEVGTKSNSPSGFNSMSKPGLNQWTKQQNEFKRAKDELLSKVASGEIAAADVGAELERLTAVKDEIAPLPEGVVMYDTLDEVLANLPAQA